MRFGRIQCWLTERRKSFPLQVESSHEADFRTLVPVYQWGEAHRGLMSNHHLSTKAGQLHSAADVAVATLNRDLGTSFQTLDEVWAHIAANPRDDLQFVNPTLRTLDRYYYQGRPRLEVALPYIAKAWVRGEPVFPAFASVK